MLLKDFSNETMTEEMFYNKVVAGTIQLNADNYDRFRKNRATNVESLKKATWNTALKLLTWMQDLSDRGFIDLGSITNNMSNMYRYYGEGPQKTRYSRIDIDEKFAFLKCFGAQINKYNYYNKVMNLAGIDTAIEHRDKYIAVADWDGTELPSGTQLVKEIYPEPNNANGYSDVLFGEDLSDESERIISLDKLEKATDDEIIKHISVSIWWGGSVPDSAVALLKEQLAIFLKSPDNHAKFVKLASEEKQAKLKALKKIK